MKQNDIILKCCVCDRIKTDWGWDYQFASFDEDKLFSHGYCPSCYMRIVQEIEDEPVTEALALAR